jgi:hypothetical protein
MITEKLLHFIWQFRHYTPAVLYTTHQEKIQVIHPGMYNIHAGPDFLDARIQIGNALLAGHVEIHILSSHWYQHRHQDDDRYRNVVLHVVWLDDRPVKDASGNLLPTLELHHVVSNMLLSRYHALQQNTEFVPCQHYLPALDETGWIAWKERLMVERLQNRVAAIQEKLAATGNHWEEVTWQLIARSFGAPVNADVFEEIAESLPFSILARHRNQMHQVEALLFGQANLLEVDFTGHYPLMLQKEYFFLRSKYQLRSINGRPAFLRMRPAGFPTIRLAQLAQLLYHSGPLFACIKEEDAPDKLRSWFTIPANDYWNNHYRFDEPAAFSPKIAGTRFADTVIINTVVPLLFSYGMMMNEELYKERALRLLAALPPEVNTVIGAWHRKGVTAINALETQALLQLKKKYCDARRCLHCSVGAKILKSAIDH